MREHEQLRRISRWNRELSLENRRLREQARRWKHAAEDVEAALRAAETFVGAAMDDALGISSQ